MLDLDSARSLRVLVKKTSNALETQRPANHLMRYSSPPESLWIHHFLKQKGNEYFCEVDVDFITDRFNLTGIQPEGDTLQRTIDYMTSPPDPVRGFDESNVTHASAVHLYGLIHARYILTSRGLHKMMDKYNNSDFGRCPRAMCRSHPLLPVGLSDAPHESQVKLYCPKCEDIYNPKSTRHSQLDSAYFGSSFPAMFFQAYPKLLPRRTSEQFTLKLFGFKIHENSELNRWQQKQREEMEKRLELRGLR